MTEKLTAYICRSCATQFTPSSTPPSECPLCTDERGGPIVPGPAFTDLVAIRKEYKQLIHKIAPELYGFAAEPKIAIGQRSMLLRSPKGNILWDCTPLVDDATVEWIEMLGGVKAIALSHPHFFSTFAEWSHVLKAPVYVHEDDREWVMRTDVPVTYWSGDRHDLHDGITLIRCGGHYKGASVLHWPGGADGKGTLLTGDVLQVIPGRDRVAFMRAFPGYIPLPAASIDAIEAALDPFEFETIHGGWWDFIVAQNGKKVFEASLKRYRDALETSGDR
jgi:hypothetical protein